MNCAKERSVDITPRTYVELQIQQCTMRAPEAIVQVDTHTYMRTRHMNVSSSSIAKQCAAQ
eukprot:10567066-Ditylum_brightwellii.AAC.1